jgi:hypothetical protein
LVRILGAELKIGDVFAVNGQQFKVIAIEPSITNPDSRKVRFVNVETKREYVRLIWNNDSLLVV